MLTVDEITRETISAFRARGRIRIAPVLTREQAIDAAVRIVRREFKRYVDSLPEVHEGCSGIHGYRHTLWRIRAEFRRIMAAAA